MEHIIVIFTLLYILYIGVVHTVHTPLLSSLTFTVYPYACATVCTFCLGSKLHLIILALNLCNDYKD